MMREKSMHVRDGIVLNKEERMGGDGEVWSGGVHFLFSLLAENFKWRKIYQKQKP